MNFKNPDFYRRSENFFPKKDNSAFLRRALSKKYKEDTSSNYNTQENINKEQDLLEEKEVKIKYKNFNNNNVVKNSILNSNENNNINCNKNFFQTYKTQKQNFNTLGSFYKKINNENKPNISEALLKRIRNKNTYNMNNMNAKKYFTTNINDDNVYQEFIINYDSGMNPDDNRLSNTQYRKKPYIMNNNNKVYNRVSLNNGIYKIDKKEFNKNFTGQNKANKIVYFNNTYQPNLPYQRRKITDINPKVPIENGMPDRIKKELYFKNNRNNLTNYNFFDKRIKRNAYNYNFNTYNQNMENYDRNYNMVRNNYNRYNNIYENNYNFNISQKDFMNRNNNIINNNTYSISHKNNQNIENKMNDFLEHFSEYCIQYYHRIIEQLFSNLKQIRDESLKYQRMQNRNIQREEKNNYNISVKNKPLQKNNYKSNYRNYITKVISTTNTENNNQNNYDRVPYHKSTDLIIDRIKYDNESKSPDKNNNFEMFRNIKELSKKYETINNRKNRQVLKGNISKLNDLSFNSYSVEKNKEKEKWEKNLEKERELKKRIQKRKTVGSKRKSKEKRNIINIQNNENMDNNKNNQVSIRNKYKKINLNKKENKDINNKTQMKIIKKIQTKDKKIQINIKYLNYYNPNPLREKKNIENKYKSLQKSNTFDITLFAIKNRNKNARKENNNAKDNKKLASIKEEKENKIEASISISDEAS